MISRRTLLAAGVASLVLLAGCSADVGVEPRHTTTNATTGAAGPTTDGPAANGTLSVHFVNVGQSDSVLVVGPSGETMLVDSGHYRNDGEYVLQYLRTRNVTRIDYFVVTHADADHIGGNAAVVEYFETEADGIGAIYDPGIAASTRTYMEYLDAVERYDVTLYETRAGDPLPLAGVDVTVMAPPEPYLADRERNENSVVLRLGFGSTGFLLTGDGEDDLEEYLVETYGSALDVTVLQAGHHGSATSTSAAFLAATTPEAVVVSSAWNSPYGHPSGETLDRLAARDAPVYWTATHGNVVFESDGTAVTVATQAVAPTDPDRLREATPVEPGNGTQVEIRGVIRPETDDDQTNTTAASAATPADSSKVQHDAGGVAA